MDEQHQSSNTPHGLLEAHVGQAADTQERQMVDVELELDDQVYAAFCATCMELGLTPEEVVRQGLAWMAEHPDEAVAWLRREMAEEGMIPPPDQEST